MSEEIATLVLGRLTDDQKRKIEKSIKATYTKRKPAWTKVDPLALLKELDAHQDRLPPRLFTILREMVEHHLLMSRDHVWEHWELMSALLVDLGWVKALAKAADLTGKSKVTIKKDYAWINKRIPPAFRREKTYRKRPTK